MKKKKIKMFSKQRCRINNRLNKKKTVFPNKKTLFKSQEEEEKVSHHVEGLYCIIVYDSKKLLT